MHSRHVCTRRENGRGRKKLVGIFVGKELRESVPLPVSSRLRVRIPQRLKHILLKSFYPTVGARGSSWVERGLSGTVESGERGTRDKLPRGRFIRSGTALHTHFPTRCDTITAFCPSAKIIASDSEAEVGFNLCIKINGGSRDGLSRRRRTTSNSLRSTALQVNYCCRVKTDSCLCFSICCEEMTR